MDRDAVIKTLKDAKAALQSRGVAHVALFGSTARGENQAGSDIDIMVEIAPGSPMGCFTYVEIVNCIKDLFPEPVDVADRQMLKPHVRPAAERDAVYAF